MRLGSAFEQSPLPCLLSWISDDDAVIAEGPGLELMGLGLAFGL